MGLTDGRGKNWHLIQEPQFLSNFRFLDSTVFSFTFKVWKKKMKKGEVV